MTRWEIVREWNKVTAGWEAHSGPCDTRLSESERTLRVMTEAANLAAARAERWENAYWSLLDNGGHL